MKKVLGFAAIIFFMMAGCFSSFAQKVKEEYEIYYVDFWIDDGNGTAMAEWSRTEGSTSYQVQLMKASSKKGHETAVVDKKLNHSTTELDVTNAIAQNGTGYYRVIVIPTKATLQFAVSETLHVDQYVLEQIRGTRQSRKGWVLNEDGKWNYYRQDGELATDCWELVDGKWYRFNSFGNMITGWRWVRGNDGLFRCYYMDPSGACQLGGVTPDGYTVDASGAWTVNGVVQVKNGP